MITIIVIELFCWWLWWRWRWWWLWHCNENDNRTMMVMMMVVMTMKMIIGWWWWQSKCYLPSVRGLICRIEPEKGYVWWVCFLNVLVSLIVVVFVFWLVRFSLTWIRTSCWLAGHTVILFYYWPDHWRHENIDEAMIIIIMTTRRYWGSSQFTQLFEIIKCYSDSPPWWLSWSGRSEWTDWTKRPLGRRISHPCAIFWGLFWKKMIWRRSLLNAKYFFYFFWFLKVFFGWFGGGGGVFWKKTI